MSGFTTRELLYPLAKGDKPGHTFHGNQYREVATDGESPTQRPPTGQFQLTNSEILAINRELSKNVKKMGQAGAYDLAAVRISKMLGFDKPAKQPKTPPSREPDLYRGCSPEGAESLLRPLERYGNGGGTARGNGVYTGIRPVAEHYVNGAMVKIWLDPDTTIANGEDVEKAYEASNIITNNLKIPLLDDEFSSFAYHPANAALLCGYQGLTSDGSTVILDRSKMTISTELRQANKDFAY